MNLCVSDEKVVINIQGIRNVTWGESTYIGSHTKPYYITVTYKGSHNIFYYQTEAEARAIFNKLRVSMDRNFKPSA
jgi:hypothetical protein